MKRMLTFSVLIVLFLCSSAVPQTAPKPYVGVFADAYHSVCSVYPRLYSQFDAWIWWLPGPGGIKGVECAIAYPSYIVRTSTTFNPDLDFMIPTCCEGGVCSCVFNSCHTEWVWLIRETFLFLVITTPSFISVVNHPLSNGVYVATCEPGYPTAPATVFTALAINQECYIAVEASTWGAIKSLYR